MNEILKIQERFQKAGFQWKEHVFNDGSFSNCMLEFTREKSPHALSQPPYPKDCVGWGRFDRETAWRMAGDWLTEEERREGEDVRA